MYVSFYKNTLKLKIVIRKQKKPTKSTIFEFITKQYEYLSIIKQYENLSNDNCYKELNFCLFKQNKIIPVIM